MSAGLQFIAHEALEERFGRWPSFHDAEVYAVRLDTGQRGDGQPSVEIDVHLFDMTRELDEYGHFVNRNHTLATLRFEGAVAIELEGFGPQNVLEDLEVEKVLAPVGGERLRVKLPGPHGLQASLRCEAALVTAVEPFEPGPHSVYSQTHAAPRLAVAAPHPGEDDVWIFTDAAGFRKLIALCRGLSEPGRAIGLSPPPGEPVRFKWLVVRPGSGPVRAVVTEDELCISGAPQQMAELGDWLELATEHNDFDSAWHMHVDAGDWPDGGWIAADSVPLVIGTWPSSV